MSGPSLTPWSNNPNAPKIPYALYLGEKAYFTGVLMGAIFYGIVIVLFFQCMGALFNPANRARGGIKWGLVAHTAAMFSFATMYAAMSFNIQSISFIDNRNFPGAAGEIPPGPVGYQVVISSKAIGMAPTPMILINNWLADGLLLYRCYVVYARNYRVIIFPCLMYLASFVTGILFIYETWQPADPNVDAMVLFGAPYFSIAISLNFYITMLVVIRLILHRRNIRNAMGAAAGVGELYKATITIIVESYAITSIVFLLFLGTWAAKSPTQYVFLQILAQTQVIAPYLVTIRIANRRASASDATDSGNVNSMHYKSRGNATGGSGIRSGGYPMNSMDTSELGVRIETTIDLHPGGASESGGSLKT